MTEFSDYLRNILLDLVFRGTTWVPPSAVYLALYRTPCSNQGRGEEISSPGYVRTPITFDVASFGGNASTVALNFEVPPGQSWGNAVCIGLEDAVTGGNQLAFDNGFGDYQMQEFDQIHFPVGSVTVEI